MSVHLQFSFHELKIKSARKKALLGDNRTRTDHLLIANQPLYQMSYIP